MNPKTHSEAAIDEIMTYWSRGKSVKETAEHFGRPYRSIEQMVVRHSHRYERSFNFPHILRAKRFGA